MLSDEDIKKIDKIIAESIVVDDTGDIGIGEEIKEIAREVTKPENRFLFSNSVGPVVFEDACLGAIGDLDNIPTGADELIYWVNRFRFHYHTGRSAIKFGMMDRFKDMIGSLLAFRGALAHMEARVPELEEKKKGFVERLRSK